MNMIKTKVKGLFRHLGYEVKRLPKGAAPAPVPDCWTWLRNTLSIGTVIDIGANNGEFAAFLHGFFRPRHLLLFEPQAAHSPTLRDRFAQIPGVRIFNTALGDREGEAQFYRNAYDPSSSLLRVSEHSIRAFPQTAEEIIEEIRIARLDDLIDPSRLAPDGFVKIDVQGVEDQVIRGGRKVFQWARCVLVEMSFVPMYCEQALFEEVHALLVELGFRLAGMKNQIDSPLTGQPMFAHCFYLR